MAKKQRAVPTGRLTRIGMLGSLATRVAGSMLTNGAGQIIKGERPAVKDLLLTPKNVSRIADQLANMRGAAMKVGQLISMDAGDILPPALTEILSRLRSDADPMPKDQLNQVMSDAMGEDWSDNFLYFSYAPIAAASIGQVHKAITPDGEMLALKVQYPGVKDSINSDVDNVATLLSMTGLLPKDVDFSPLLEEAKRQLHAEADYIAEADMLTRYHKVIGDDDRFALPEAYPNFTSETLLAMSFMKSEPIESQLSADQATRDAIGKAMFELFFVETFDHGLIQTDPNFANYRYDPETQQIVLLDFGATRDYPRDFVELYRELLSGVYYEQPERVRQAAIDIGLMSPTLASDLQDFIVDMCFEACEPIRHEGIYDFAQSDLTKRLHDKGMALSNNEAFWHVPPANSVFLHRKLGGTFLLTSNLKARVNMREIAARFVTP